MIDYKIGLDFLHYLIGNLLLAAAFIFVGIVIGVKFTMDTVENNLAYWGWQEIEECAATCKPLDYSPADLTNIEACSP